MRLFVSFITLCLCGQAFDTPGAERDPRDPRFEVLPTRAGALPLVVAASSKPAPVETARTNEAVLPEAAKPTPPAAEQQKLGPGDRISYRVIEDQDEPRSLTITDSGDLEVPYFGLIHAAGKTSLQLASEIKARLEEKLYHQASVIIAVELVNRTRVTGKVYVTGQVRNKGGYDIPAGEALTVSKAILNAGGFSDFSDKKNVRLVRKTPQGQQTSVVNVVNVWDKGRLEEDLVVQPDDLIVVPARLLNY
ncbi:MAG TPA: polysaccharide biosynthesis/export family protein [Candidatus Paceibacterota bacterium]|nr:polysaccharide biosynthesis/export family protein [Verrucomicrobiota bacterium]HSA08812.1 polysaccharide biosynthesis/export family protein [Candidatus Paceibacterota bacterium]